MRWLNPTWAAVTDRPIWVAPQSSVGFLAETIPRGQRKLSAGFLAARWDVKTNRSCAQMDHALKSTGRWNQLWKKIKLDSVKKRIFFPRECSSYSKVHNTTDADSQITCVNCPFWERRQLRFLESIARVIIVLVPWGSFLANHEKEKIYRALKQFCVSVGKFLSKKRNRFLVWFLVKIIENGHCVK